MSSTAVRLQVARRLGLVGGAARLLAGLTQVLFGTHIPDWSGAKADPVALGLLTLALSTVAILSARALPGGQAPPHDEISGGAKAGSAERRVAAACGLFLPAALCFTTVGRLWFLPGALLLAATAAALSVGGLREFRAVASAYWLRVLLSLLGCFQLLMAVTAASVTTLVVGVAGGLAVLASWVPAGARTRLLLVTAGTVPFAVLTWSSLVTPLLALTAIAISVALVPVWSRRSGSHRGTPPRVPQTRAIATSLPMTASSRPTV